MFTLLYNNEIIKYNIYRNEHDVDTIWSPKIPLELSLFGDHHSSIKDVQRCRRISLSQQN